MSSPLTYLFSLEQFGIKLGLEQIRALVAALDHPDRAFTSIVVAGTNGKGSVTAMIERGLRAAGYRTGRYTSPHLTRLEERFVIDGREIDGVALAASANRLRDAAARLPFPPSFFEATTAIAFDLFREAHVDVAVLEVGLGGRLDATNVVTPAAVAITAIDFDHEAYLGNTIQAIAAEKAGVIKPGVVVTLGRNPDEAREVVRHACDTRGATLIDAVAGVTAIARLDDGQTVLRLTTPARDYGTVRLGLRGRHQIDNAVTAVRTLESLAPDFAIEENQIRTALEDVVWPARLELRTWRDRQVLIDGAHNPAGARALASYLHETYGRPVPIIVGAMRDKAIDGIVVALAPAAAAFVFTAPESPRAARPDDLADLARRLAPQIAIHTAADPADALAIAHEMGDPIVVAGSLYLAGEIRALSS